MNKVAQTCRLRKTLHSLTCMHISNFLVLTICLLIHKQATHAYLYLIEFKKLSYVLYEFESLPKRCTSIHGPQVNMDKRTKETALALLSGYYTKNKLHDW